MNDEKPNKNYPDTTELFRKKEAQRIIEAKRPVSERWPQLFDYETLSAPWKMCVKQTELKERQKGSQPKSRLVNGPVFTYAWQQLWK